MTHGTKYPAEQLEKYPHFFPRDIPIWERFLARFGDDFSSFAYDVKVGSGTEPVEGLGPNYVRMQRILSKYRIDAVGFRSDSVVILEVKPDAGTIAIGQIETYTNLYKRDFNPNKPIVGGIVTDRELPDMAYLTDLKGIEYYIV